MTYPALTDEQRAALEAFALDHSDSRGEPWRERLGDCWRNGTEPEAHKPALRQVRNLFGPTWLHDVYAWGWLPECPAWSAMTGEERRAATEAGQDVPAVRWSAPFPPPAVGGRVKVRMNGLGLATVTGYFVQDGWLGVVVKLDAPPEWYGKQNGGNVPGHSFGAEIELISAC